MKKKFIKTIMPVLVSLIMLIQGCYSADFLGGLKVATETITRWASSAPVTSAGEVKFLSVAVDSNGNIYAVGYIKNIGNYDFGTGNISGTSNGSNVLIIKYNSSGIIQWSKTVGPTSTAGNTCFNSVAVDSNGNIYAAGYITGLTTNTATYYFNSSNIFKTLNSGEDYKHVVIVKYNSSGEALWASSTYTAPAASEFQSVAVDSSGNIYAAGYINGNTQFNFNSSGTDGQVTGKYTPGNNVVLVKYNSSGTVLWAKSVTAASNPSIYNSVITDASGNIYASGNISNTSMYTPFTFGSSPEVIVAGGTLLNFNTVLVKYNSSGDALWAKSTAPGSVSTRNNSVAVDASGNIYTAGFIITTASANFGTAGTPVTAAGTSSTVNICLVKYNSSGDALWAKSNSTGSTLGGYSYLNSVVVNASGDIFCSGHIINSSSILNIDSQSVTGMPSGNLNLTGFIVKFNSTGTAQWIRSSSTESSPLIADSQFNSVTVDSNGYIYVAGYVYTGNNNNTVLFGNNISITQGVSQYSPVVVKYKEMNIVNFE